MRSFEQGNIDQAIDTLARGVCHRSTRVELQYHLGLLHGPREDISPRSMHWRPCRAFTGHFSALTNLAVVYQRAGFRHKAV